MNPEMIEQLKNPEVFPERPEEVEIIQTHLSIVCLAGDRVYKLKKSIKLPFANFSSLENRHDYCEEELRLNRRLCPEVYLGVVPLVKLPAGHLKFAVRGDQSTDAAPIDWAVRMTRLPADRMLDVLLEAGRVEEEEIDGIASRMVAFHKKARRGREVADLGDPRKLRQFAFENFEETRSQTGKVFPADLHRALENRTRQDFDRSAELLQQRAEDGFVVDGHGDLHARNICLTDPVTIYDCIEFNPGFRCGDVASEHAFLVMDLRFRGEAHLAHRYLKRVTDLSGDEDLGRLLPMLVRYRAMVRAKVAAITAGEDEISAGEQTKAAETARAYLRFAGATALEDRPPLWIALCGLPATGKSTLAGELKKAAGETWPLFSSDPVRKELAGFSPDERLPGSYYQADFSRRTYDELYRRAQAASGKEPLIILDANFRSREERSQLGKAARQSGARLALIEVTANEERIRDRLRERAASNDSASDADLEVYERLKTTFEPPLPDEADQVVKIPSDPNPGLMVDRVIAKLVSV